MNILFLTLSEFESIEEQGIYTDLMREFVKNNHALYIISPYSNNKLSTPKIIDKGKYKILKLSIGINQKKSLLKKGISTLTLDSKFKKGIKQHFSNVKFEVVIYSTPPITLQNTVKYVKERDNAKAYLLLKDIFPQNAIDLGMLKRNGVYGLVYRYFRHKERKLYAQSDFIGCMSKANVDFILHQNHNISPNVVEVCPNSLEPLAIDKNEYKMEDIRRKYNIPIDKTVFIYGGNLGKPQGIDFLIRCLDANKNNEKVYFVIVGSGTEFNKINNYFKTQRPNNAQLYDRIPKDDYETLVNSCDVGLLFLDDRFTIPNFPSRILSYMQASLPVLAATDINTDIGKVIEEGEFGYWCVSNNVEQFNNRVQLLCNEETRKKFGINARKYLEKNYTSKHSYDIIMNHFK